MKFLSRIWLILASIFQSKVDPDKQAMLNVIDYIERYPSMWDQNAYPNGRIHEPTCFGGLLLREYGLGHSTRLDDLPDHIYRYLSLKSAFAWYNKIEYLKQVVKDYKP